jgi:hypothetical protein
MSEQEVKDFIQHYPGELDAETLQKIRELTRQRFGQSITSRKEVKNDFISDGEFSYHIPNDGFIHDYLTYTKGLEAPLEFGFFCAVAVLGQAVGRRQYIDRGAYKIYPPTPLVLVAPSGICRKTSAVQLAVKLARAVDVPTIANKITPEDFIRQLQDSHRGASPLISAPELSVLIGKQKYNVGLIEILTDLLDCPDYWESGTIMRGRTQLHNVTLGLLGASTPKWLKTSVPVEAFAGGFMSRLLVVVKHDTPRDVPNPRPLDKELWDRMVGFLEGVRAFEGAIDMTEEAQEWFTSWYMNMRKEGRRAGDESVGYYSRKPDHLLRLAMNLQISRGEHKLTELVLEEANDAFGWLENNTPPVIKMLLATEHGQVATTILQSLRKAGGHLPRNTLVRNAVKHFTPRLVHEALSHLSSTNQIGRYDGGERTQGDVIFLKNWEDE